jgi:hypothetical protein
MKRLTLTFLAFSLIAFFATAQVNNPYGPGNANASRDFETCPQSSLFGQTPMPPTGGWTSPISDLINPTDGLYANYYENFSGVTGEICSLSFWGFPWQRTSIWFPCNENPMTFRIRIYQNNSGNLGNLVVDFNADILGQGTGLTYVEAGGEIGELLYYFVQLPEPINLNSGWVSVQGISYKTPVNCAFGWMNSFQGDNLSFYESPAGSLYTVSYNFSLCLGTACETEQIPVSTWALILGGALIALFVFVRYRRII